MKIFKRCIRESTANMDESKSKRLKLLSFGDDISLLIDEILPLNSIYHRSPAMEKSIRFRRPSVDDRENMDKFKRLELDESKSKRLELDESKSKRHRLLSFGEDISTEILPLNSVYHPEKSKSKSNPLNSVSHPEKSKSNRGYRKPNQRPSYIDYYISYKIVTPDKPDKSRRLDLQRLGGEDICTQILLRLPVKSILKFKTVSKLWLSIVSSNRFRQAHASGQSRSATDLFFKYGLSSSVEVLPINRHKPKIRTFLPPVPRPSEYGYTSLTCVSSCNGLQLLKSPKPSNDIYHIYNPTTQEYKFLDLPPHIAEYKYVCASLAFDPSESLHYKIIFLCKQTQEIYGSFKLEVYSSATGTCERVSNTVVYGSFGYDDNRGIFCNGAIHWLPRSTASIAYFNVHTECKNELIFPFHLCLVRYFGESQGHLHLVNTDHRNFYKSSFLYVNELKRDYSCWFLKYKVELASIISAFPDDCYGNFISSIQGIRSYNEEYIIQGSDYCGTYMSIIRDEEEDEDEDEDEDGDHSTMVLVACGEWVEYNFKKKTTKRLCKFMNLNLLPFPPWSYWFYIYQFIPTLTCI